MALSIGVFGKITWNGTAYVGDTPTTTDILGPFYRPGAPMRSNIIPPGSTGSILRVQGTVYKKDGRSPLPGAMVEVWQVDEGGHYDNLSDAYLCRGMTKTGNDGRYYFKTVMPVPYPAGKTTRPAHIHFRVSEGTHRDLITQIYFKGDPHLQEDSSSSNALSVSRILELTDGAGNEKKVRFDIVLNDEYPLDASVYEKISGLYEMSDKSNAEFFRKGDLLFVKINGQIAEALYYKGNNTFEGGLQNVTVVFELLADGGVKAHVAYDNEKVEGTKILKYKA